VVVGGTVVVVVVVVVVVGVVVVVVVVTGARVINCTVVGAGTSSALMVVPQAPRTNIRLDEII